MVPSAQGMSFRVKQIAAFGKHALALTMDGQVYSWGANDRGQLGLGHTQDIRRPHLVPDLYNVAAVSCGEKHSAAICEIKSTVNGKGLLANNVFLFGDNSHGQLGLGKGQGTLFSSPTPLRHLDIDGNGTIHSVWCGDNHTMIQVLTLVLRNTDSNKGTTHIVEKAIYTFGQNKYGQLGIGNCVDADTPTRVRPLDNAEIWDVSLGRSTSFVWVDKFPKDVSHEIKRGIYSCGLNDQGETGIGKDQTTHRYKFARVDKIPENMSGQVASSSFSVVFPIAKKGAPHIPFFVERLQPKIEEPRKYETEKKTEEDQDNKVSNSSLERDMGKLLDEKILCDVILRAGGESTRLITETGSKPEGIHTEKSRRHNFPCHSEILACRCARISQVVQQHLSKVERVLCVTKKDGNKVWGWEHKPVTVVLDGVSEPALRVLLRFIYTGSPDSIGKLSAATLLDLAWASKVYGLDRLLGLCQNRIARILEVNTVIPIVARAAHLGLLAIKRTCFEFIHTNYRVSVSERNRVAVDSLHGTPALMAEVVGLASPDIARSIIQSLPQPNHRSASTLVQDLARLRDGGSFANMEFILTHNKHNSNGGSTGAPITCHAIILVARCPIFRKACLKTTIGSKTRHTVLSPKSCSTSSTSSSSDEEGDDDHEIEYGPRDHEIQQLLIDSKNNEATYIEPIIEGISSESHRLQVREPTEASPNAIQVFLEYLYTDSTKNVRMEDALDLLILSHVYGLEKSHLGQFCESLLINNLSPDNVIEIICVATQLNRHDLVETGVNFFKQNARESIRDSSKVKDAFEDFPDLALRLLQAVVL